MLASLREIGAIWDEALCAIDMATVLDPDDPEVRAAADAGRVILTRLGATPFLAQLDAAMSRDVGPRSPSQVASPAEVATS